MSKTDRSATNPRPGDFDPARIYDLNDHAAEDGSWVGQAIIYGLCGLIVGAAVTASVLL